MVNINYLMFIFSLKLVNINININEFCKILFKDIKVKVFIRKY